MITVSYIFLNLISVKSSQLLTQGPGNEMIKNRNRKMQRKISIIIATDFLCWIPFITVCFLHTLGIIDATPWYALFSIIILPINSVINPLLYDSKITSVISSFSGRIQTTIKTSLTSPEDIRSPDANKPCFSNVAVEMNNLKDRHAPDNEKLPCPNRCAIVKSVLL